MERGNSQINKRKVLTRIFPPDGNLIKSSNVIIMIRKHQKIIITKTFTRGRYKNWRISLVLSLLLLWHEKCGRHAMMISGGSRGAPVTETFLTRWSVWPSLGFCMLAHRPGGSHRPSRSASWHSPSEMWGTGREERARELYSIFNNEDESWTGESWSLL